MNRLKVRTRVYQEPDEPADPALWTEILVDGNLLVDFQHSRLAIDFLPLARSLQGDGEYLIVTCSCGIAACAGIQRGVRVRYDNVNVQWAVYELGPTQTFVFGRQDYRQAIRQGWQQFKRLCAAHPEMRSVPGHHRSVLRNPTTMEALLA